MVASARARTWARESGRAKLLGPAADAFPAVQSREDEGRAVDDRRLRLSLISGLVWVIVMGTRFGGRCARLRFEAN